MSLKAVRDILNTHLNAYTPTLNIAWENVAFTPKTNETHVRVNFVPTESKETARFKSAMVRETGFYQIDVYAPQDQGTSSVDTLVEGLRAHFNRGRVLSDSNNNRVNIRDTPKTSQGRREGGYYRVTITVDWFAHFTQP
jgi:hypothetical protein